MARQRYQRGSIVLRGKHPQQWVARWREDIIRPGETTVHRVRRAQVIGTLADYPTKKLALRELARLVEKSNVNAIDYKPRPTMLFRDFATKWKLEVLSQHKASTRSSCASVINTSLISAFGEFAMRDISTVTVQHFVSRSTKSPKTTRNHIAILQMMWKQARAWELVTRDRDLFDGLVLPKNHNPQEAASFTLAQMQQIINACGEWWRTFFWLAAETGLRVGELTALRVQDLDVDECKIRVRQSCWRGQMNTTKTKRGVRDCVISRALVNQLVLHGNNGLPTALLFQTANSKPLDQGAVRHKLYALLDALKIPRAGMHAFRHGNASLMDQLNAPSKLRQQRLGHSDERMMLHYSHANSRDEQDLAGRLGDMLTPAIVGLDVGLKPN